MTPLWRYSDSCHNVGCCHFLRRRRSVTFYTFTFVSFTDWKVLARSSLLVLTCLQGPFLDHSVTVFRILAICFDAGNLQCRLSVTLSTFTFVSFLIGNVHVMSFPLVPHLSLEVLFGCAVTVLRFLGSLLQLSRLRLPSLGDALVFCFCFLSDCKALLISFHWYSIYLWRFFFGCAVAVLRFLGSLWQLSHLHRRLSVTL